jgi:hypothetical protein
MRKIIGSLLLFVVITISAISCGGATPAEAPKDGEKKECCSDKEKCEHKKPEACADDCAKPCCNNKVEKTDCPADCIKPCCNNKVEKTDCPADCKKECCTDK